jgi:hypothetical protein
MTDEHVMGHRQHHFHLVALKIYRRQVACDALARSPLSARKRSNR